MSGKMWEKFNGPFMGPCNEVISPCVSNQLLVWNFHIANLANHMISIWILLIFETGLGNRKHIDTKDYGPLFNCEVTVRLFITNLMRAKFRGRLRSCNPSNRLIYVNNQR